MAHTVSQHRCCHSHHSAGTVCCKWCPFCLLYHWEASTARRELCHWWVRPGSWELMEALKERRKVFRDRHFFFFFGDCTCHFLRWIFSRTLMRPWIWSNGWHMITIIWQVCTLSIFLFLSMCVQCVGTASVWVVGFQHFRLHSSNLCQFPG